MASFKGEPGPAAPMRMSSSRVLQALPSNLPSVRQSYPNHSRGKTGKKKTDKPRKGGLGANGLTNQIEVKTSAAEPAVLSNPTAVTYSSELVAVNEDQANTSTSIEELSLEDLGRSLNSLSITAATSIHDLSSGPLVEILSKLDVESLLNCAVVFPKWEQVARHSVTKLELSKSRHLFTLPVLLPLFPRLAHLAIQGPFENTASRLAERLSETAKAPQSIKPLLLRKLRTISIWKCHTLTDYGLAILITESPLLHKLELIECQDVSGNGFIGLRCLLRELVIDRCADWTPVGLQAAGAACPKLDHLKICAQETKYEGQLAPSLQWLAQGCPDLTSLYCSDCGCDDQTLYRIASACPELSDVTIKREAKISDAGMAGLVDWLPGLKSLKLTKVSGIPFCARGSQSLERLCLSGMNCQRCDLPNVQLRQVVLHQKLRNLCIKSCPKLTTDTLNILITSCRSLEVLSVKNCPLIEREKLSTAKSGLRVDLTLVETQ